MVRRIKNYFRSVETRHSEAQLREDFGEYPPHPLVGAGLRPFSLVKTRWPWNHYDRLVLMKQLIRDDAPTLPAGDLNEAAEVANFRESAEEIRNFLDRAALKMNVSRSLMRSFAVFFITPILLFLLVILERKRNIEGYFMPAGDNSSKIMVRVGKLKTRSRLEAVISHEHLHLLQYRDHQYARKAICSLETLFEDKYKNDRSLLYLLEKAEVEARLHELVLSFYRISKKLPQTINDFHEMLAANNYMGWVIESVFLSHGRELSDRVEKYDEREHLFVKQFDLVLHIMKDNDAVFRFITEVLPVMYGNLLRYYGDASASARFLEQIDRPNLFDALYEHAR